MLEGIRQEICRLPGKDFDRLLERFTDVTTDGESWKAQRGLQNASKMEIMGVLYCEMFQGNFYCLTQDDTRAIQNPFFRYASLEAVTANN